MGTLLKVLNVKQYKICIISDKEVFGESKRKLTKKEK